MKILKIVSMITLIGFAPYLMCELYFTNYSDKKAWVYTKNDDGDDFVKWIEPHTSVTITGKVRHIWALTEDIISDYEMKHGTLKDDNGRRSLAALLNLDQELGSGPFSMSFDIDKNNKPYLYFGKFEIDKKFILISLSDVHVQDSGSNDQAKQLCKVIKKYIAASEKNIQGVAFVGDSAGGYGNKAETKAFKDIYYNPLVTALKATGGNIFLVPGNHDCYGSGSGEGDVPEMLEFIKEKHAHRTLYNFNIGPVKFICLGLYASSTENQRDARNASLLKSDPSSLQYLKNVLAKIDKQQPVVIMFHYPIYGDYSTWWHKSEKNDLYTTIKDYNVIAILVGHDHGQSVDLFRGKIPTIKAAGGDNFALIFFDPNNPKRIDTKMVDIKGVESWPRVRSRTAADETDFVKED